ncbi:hypothetical protein [Salegentibacter maritimus]|uniref:Uncharacterized protein n=1 Tax=Salegentibacter maritimus TaxID=2794347 RepID=A0ABS0TIA2_9FLAO|nr:hypothetical protein [Salegentibacter maritimus]MBI6120785.1 hypothetical protein [Salegentibacter maritimus]
MKPLLAIQIMKKIYLSFLFTLFFSLTTYSQAWPFTPMIRFGNATYIKFEEQKLNDLSGNKIILEKKITNRFFDPLLKMDSLKIEINNKIQTFHQKSRNEPNHEKLVLYYSRRKLQNQNFKITYLKLLDFTEDYLIAEATIIDKINKEKSKEIIRINMLDLKGFFLGTGEKLRTLVPIISVAGTLVLVLLI